MRTSDWRWAPAPIPTATGAERKRIVDALESLTGHDTIPERFFRSRVLAPSVRRAAGFADEDLRQAATSLRLSAIELSRGESRAGRLPVLRLPWPIDPPVLGSELMLDRVGAGVVHCVVHRGGAVRPPRLCVQSALPTTSCGGVFRAGAQRGGHDRRQRRPPRQVDARNKVILVVDAGSDDATGADPAELEDRGVRAARSSCAAHPRRGRASPEALNAGGGHHEASLAQDRWSGWPRDRAIVVVVDADGRLDRQALSCSPPASPTTGSEAVQCRVRIYNGGDC